MKKVYLFLLCSSCLQFCLYAQKIGIDRKGKSIFTHLSSADARVEISSEEPFSISYFYPCDTIPFVLVRTGDTTVLKIRGAYGQISLLNSGENFILTDLDDANPGVGLKAGFQSTIEVFHNINAIPGFYLGTYTWGVNGVLNLENIRLYDSVSNQVSRKYPVTIGIEGNYNIFFKNWTKSSNRVILAFNGAVTRTWNDDDLLNYQDISKTTVLPAIVALKDFKGRYGTLDRNVIKVRFSFAFPMYIRRFNPIPYVVYSSASSKVSYNYGIFLNFTDKKLTKTKFKIPSSIGAGVDWVGIDGKPSDPSIFVKGALSFGKFKDE